MPDRRLLTAQKFDVQCRDDFADDLVLDLETIVEPPVVGLRPDGMSGLDVNQFRLDAQVSVRPAHATLQNIAYAQGISGVLGIQVAHRVGAAGGDKKNAGDLD